MAESRIKIAKDKADLVQELTVAPGTTGPFQTYADAIAFSAVLGAKHNKRVPLGEISRKEPGPISIDIFISRGYDLVIKLLAIAETQDINILSPNDVEVESDRVHIFEEYANGGLEILREELKGAVDYTERLLLMLSLQRNKQEQPPGEFDLSRFLS